MSGIVERKIESCNGATIYAVKVLRWPDGYCTVGFRVKRSDGTSSDHRWLSEARQAAQG